MAQPLHLIVPPGVSANFHCEYGTQPTRWTKAGANGEFERELPPGVEQFSDGTLQIEEATAAHQGKYFCESVPLYNAGTGERDTIRRSEPVRLEVLAPKQEVSK